MSDTVATSRLAGDLIKGALEAARERGLCCSSVRRKATPELERLLLQAMHDRQVDGMILASMFTQAIKVPEGITSRPGGPAQRAAQAAHPRCPPVIPDEVEAGRARRACCSTAGHREGIHLIGAGPACATSPAGASRRWSGSSASARRSARRASRWRAGRICRRLAAGDGLAATRRLLEPPSRVR